MRIGAIIQARMTSTRLPGKVLMELYNGKSMLELVINRLSKSELIDQIIIATTINDGDDPIVELCEKKGVLYFRGSEDNVLERYYQTAKYYELDIIIRVTSDCPLIDWVEVDRVIQTYIDTSTSEGYDYVSNIIERTYPRGLDTELITMKTLEKVYMSAETKSEKEHVTRRILLTNPIDFRTLNVRNILKTKLDVSKYRLTVDTPEDKELIIKIYQELDDEYVQQNEIISFLEEHLDLLKINQNIEQKLI